MIYDDDRDRDDRDRYGFDAARLPLEPWEDDEALIHACPMCGFESLDPGHRLGQLEHHCCRACGAWYSIDRSEEGGR